MSKWVGEGGGDKLTGQLIYSTNFNRVGFVEMGGRTVEATNTYFDDKQFMARVCRNWSGEVEAVCANAMVLMQ